MVDAEAMVERFDAMFSVGTTHARKAKAPAPASSHHNRTMMTLLFGTRSSCTHIVSTRRGTAPSRPHDVTGLQPAGFRPGSAADRQYRCAAARCLPAGGPCDSAGGVRAWNYTDYTRPGWPTTASAQSLFDPLWGTDDLAAGDWFGQQALQLAQLASPPPPGA